MKPDAASVWKESRAKLRWNFMFSFGLGQSMIAGMKLPEFTISDSNLTGETPHECDCRTSQRETTEFCLLKKTPVFVPPVTHVAILFCRRTYLLYVRRLHKMSTHGALYGPSFVLGLTPMSSWSSKSRKKSRTFCLQCHGSSKGSTNFTLLLKNKTSLLVQRGTLFRSPLILFYHRSSYRT